MSSPGISTQHTTYRATSLSEEGVARNSGFLMWDTQPARFKSYPKHLFSYAWDAHESFDVIRRSRFISSQIQVAGKPYPRLNTPSAGNLHPLELYVQIRGIKGVLSGIYHVDVQAESLVLVQEIEADGLERYVGMKERFNGMLFIVTGVYFRSFWKYGLRAWRYLFLDAGHQIGALQASLALYQKEGVFLSDFDAKGLNHIMGFEQQEHVLAVLAVGETKEKPAQTLETSLMQVQPTDYVQRDMTMQAWLAEAKPFSAQTGNVYISYEAKSLEKAIVQRRSARAFILKSLYSGDLQYLIHNLMMPSFGISFSYAVLDSQTNTAGLYHGRTIGQSSHIEKLPQRIHHLLVNQSIVASASMVLFISCDEFNEEVLMRAGQFAHKVYIDSAIRGLGCSGIGAFYDEELCHLLQKKYMLYAIAIGNI